MEKKNIDWANLGFGYIQTDKRYVSNYKNGAWDEGGLTDDATVVINECAGVLQYAQTVFEGLKAYTTEDGHIVTFRPDLNAERLEQSAKRLEMPVFPVYPSVSVRNQSCHWREACGRVSVPYVLYSGRPLLQGRRKADYHLRI